MAAARPELCEDFARLVAKHGLVGEHSGDRRAQLAAMKRMSREEEDHHAFIRYAHALLRTLLDVRADLFEENTSEARRLPPYHPPAELGNLGVPATTAHPRDERDGFPVTNPPIS
jgi:hypothetical protein